MMAKKKSAGWTQECKIGGKGKEATRNDMAFWCENLLL